jgi:hypothetical protein
VILEREKVRARGAAKGSVCVRAKRIEREREREKTGKKEREIEKQNDHDGRVQRDANTAHAFAE